AIRTVLDAASAAGSIKLVTHLPRPDFLTLLRHADILVGNSSSGIIEAASFGTRVLNIGSRQRLRQRSSNVVDVAPEAEQIVGALAPMLGQPRSTGVNVYGDGAAGERIVSILA